MKEKQELEIMYPRRRRTKIGTSLFYLPFLQIVSSIATHKLQDIIRHNGHVQCPLTGWLIRENRLVDPLEEGEDCFERSYIKELHDHYLGLFFESSVSIICFKGKLITGE